MLRDGSGSSFADKRIQARHSLASEKRFAFADQSQSQMRERGKIAAGADRAFFRYHRMDAAVEHFTKHQDTQAGPHSRSLPGNQTQP